MDIKDFVDKICIDVNVECNKMKDEDLLKIGYCPRCGVEMVKFNKITKQPISKTNKYSDYWVELNNGTKMRIAICIDCIDSIDDVFIKEYMKKERNTQAYQLFSNPKIDKKKMIRGVVLVGSYKAIKHGKKEPKVKKEKDGK